MRSIVIKSSQLYAAASRFHGAGARGKELIGHEEAGPIDALALAPDSEVREVWLWFDGDPDPVLLTPGRVIARSCARVGFAPVMPCTFASGDIGLDFAPSPDLAPARLMVDAWTGSIPLSHPTSRAVCVDRGEVVYTPQSTDPELCLLVSVPGARVLRVWGSNNGTANNDAATLEVRAMRPQVEASSDPRSFVASPMAAAGAVLATLTIPAAADDSWRVETAIVDPGVREIGFFLTPGSTDPVTFACGVEIES